MNIGEKLWEYGDALQGLEKKAQGAILYFAIKGKAIPHLFNMNKDVMASEGGVEEDAFTYGPVSTGPRRKRRIKLLPQ